MQKRLNKEEVKEGDMIWAYVKGADQNYGYGEVCSVWYHEGLMWFDFFDQINGGKRSSNVLKIIEKPGARMESKLLQTLKEVRDIKRGK